MEEAALAAQAAQAGTASWWPPGGCAYSATSRRDIVQICTDSAEP